MVYDQDAGQRLRVFVSSTLDELAAERGAARAAIEGLRLTPVMFESGAGASAAGGVPGRPGAVRHFVGIYWQRYGWVGPDMTNSGLEDELRLAAGMPRLLYAKVPAPGPGVTRPWPTGGDGAGAGATTAVCRW